MKDGQQKGHHWVRVRRLGGVCLAAMLFGCVAEAPTATDQTATRGALAGSASVSTNQSSYAIGATVTVSYAGLPGNIHDWIAIAPAGSPFTTHVAFVFTNGQTSGTATFTAPATAGSYVARAFANDDEILLAESVPFSVGASVSTDKTSYAPGATVTVTYAGLPGNVHDWIAIASTGSPFTSHVAFVFTNGQASGTATFTAPAAGSYVARAFANDDEILLAESATFTVGATATISTDHSSYSSGSTITVSYAGLPGNFHDWIAIASTGSPFTSHVAFVFTNGQISGTVTFTAPAAGSYVARAFANDDEILLAESVPFSVGATVSTDKTSYAPGATVTVTYAGLPGNLHDWIAIASTGSPFTSHVAFVFTNGQISGTATFSAPAAGSYVARAFANDDEILLAESATFTSQAPLTFSFAVPSDFAVGDNPRALAAADFNGDGMPDLAVANVLGPSVSILLGAGPGSFQAAVTHAVGAQPQWIATGDFNRDGRVDLVTASSAHALSVLLGNGDGTFQAAPDVAASGFPVSVATADFNGDGKLDLAAADFNGNAVLLYVGHGDGTFGASGSYAAGPGPGDLAIGDFNGDGKTDLVVASRAFNGINVSVLLGNGNGTLQAAVSYPVGGNPRAVGVGDFNSDGKVDIVVPLGIGLRVLFGNGNGTFQAAVSRPGRGLDMAIADWNADGRLDLTLVNDATNSMDVLLGNGDGTFQPILSTGSHSSVWRVIGGDWNGDGRQDAILANSDDDTVSLFAGNGNGTFQAPAYYGAGTNAIQILRSDFNGDGRQDLAVASSSSAIFLGNADGTFQAAVNLGAGVTPVASGDWNGDGKTDLVVPGSPSGVKVLLGNGDGSFVAGATYGLPCCLAPATTGDWNLDGKTDLAFADNQHSVIRILLGNGDGTFVVPADSDVANAVTFGFPDGVISGDWNADGKPDLACTAGATSNGNVNVFIGNGDGTFRSSTSFAVGSDPRSLVAGDWNGDGKIDFAVPNNSASYVSILLGNGNGTFQAATQFDVGQRQATVVTADWNKDGKADLAVVGAREVIMILGNGNGTFQIAARFAAGASPWGIVTGDWNGDQKPDFAVTDYQGAGFRTFINTSH